ncbi:hypothetical protein GCM10023219_21450 [Stakelama sediminis]
MGAGEFAIGQMGMNGAMADRMQRHCFASAAAFGNDVMPLDTPAQCSAAQGADAGRTGRVDERML